MATNTVKATSKKTARKSPMTSDHKAALAKGREEGRIVRRYLEALESTRPRRGRKRTSESIKRRLKTIDGEMATAVALRRLQLIQEELDLEAELGTDEELIDLPGIEKEFVKVGKAYGTRKGVSYAAWRSVGVSVQVLQKAGIARTRG